MDLQDVQDESWLSDAVEELFPLNDIPSIVRLFRQQLESRDPDLALLSIVAGAVENNMTSSRVCKDIVANHNDDVVNDDLNYTKYNVPEIDFKTTQDLYIKFRSIIVGSVDKTKFNTDFATRDLVKRVADVIWNSLTRSFYKDKPHLQSLYSYLTGNKLDCFGVAFAVVAACQVLGFQDVHLALSEDHFWVVFGEHGSENAEVTWHGKGNEDKRGQPIGVGAASTSWLYMNGCPVICTREMEVAALVSGMNPTITPTLECLEVAILAQELSWLLYDLRHLDRYPMALCFLADLEDLKVTPGRRPCSALFEQATHAARMYYNNQHVYPHSYRGGFLFRQKKYKESLECWADAADVIRKYNYAREDEDIYKEFLEIANEHIPQIIKDVSSGHSAHSILKDPECFAHLLRFYDGICQWEEGSATPVLHIGWAKPLVNTISKFDAEVRAKVTIEEATADNVEREEATVWWEEMDLNSNPYHNQFCNNNEYCKYSIKGKPKVKQEEQPHPSIAALTMACGEKILNREYLLGGREPFVASDVPGTSAETDGDAPKRAVVSETIDATSSGSAAAIRKSPSRGVGEIIEPRVILKSQKMKGLKELLLAEKLNTQAISLQLTAQSQVQVVKRGSLELNGHARPKRMRRD